MMLTDQEIQKIGAQADNTFFSLRERGIGVQDAVNQCFLDCARKIIAANNAKVLADMKPVAMVDISSHQGITAAKPALQYYRADHIAALNELQSEQNRSELFNSLLNNVAKALGKKFGDSHHDLADQVSALIQRNEALEKALEIERLEHTTLKSAYRNVELEAIELNQRLRDLS